MENSNLKVEIKGYGTTKLEHSDSKTIYKMVISKGDSSWDIRRSYSDFYQFHSQMKEISANLPKLPKKKARKVVKTEDLDKRQQGLQEYCDGLCQKGDIHSNLEFIRFFEIDRNTDMKVVNQLQLVFRKTHQVFGYKDIAFYPEHRMMFGITSSKKGGIFKKEVVKGQESGGRTIHTGDLQAWLQKKGKDDILEEYERLWHLHFKAKGLCVHFDSIGSVVYNGWENGDIIGFYIDVKRPHKYKQVLKGTFHKDNVISIWADGAKKRLYSIGDDKMLHVICLEKNKILNSAKISKSRPTLMKVDSSRDIAMISNRKGQVHIFDLKQTPPAMMQVIKCKNKSHIKGLDFDMESGNIFISTFDKKTIYHYQMKGEGNFTASSEIVLKGEYKTQVEPREIAYWPFRNELYVGFSNGCVSVFEVSNFESGPIYTAMEHEKDIRVTRFIEGLGMIVTCSDDKFTNFWMPPRSWRNEEKEELEEEIEVEVKTKSKKVLDDSSSDDGYGKMGKSSSSEDDSDSEDIEIKKRKEARKQAKAKNEADKKKALLAQESSDSDSDVPKKKKKNTKSKIKNSIPSPQGSQKKSFKEDEESETISTQNKQQKVAKNIQKKDSSQSSSSDSETSTKKKKTNQKSKPKPQTRKVSESNSSSSKSTEIKKPQKKKPSKQQKQSSSESDSDSDSSVQKKQTKQPPKKQNAITSKKIEQSSSSSSDSDSSDNEKTNKKKISQKQQITKQKKPARKQSSSSSDSDSSSSDEE